MITAEPCSICEGKGEVRAHLWWLPEGVWRPILTVEAAPEPLRRLLREEEGKVWKLCLCCDGSGASKRQESAPP